MCGIAGWYRRRGRPVCAPIIVEQCDKLHHRGPDDVGHLIDGDFGFGMRRLSIVDIAGGRQPIRSPDGRHVIIFNGEIYNHPELRSELVASGVRFGTHSDTETLLHAYLRWGEDAWLRLEGMYSVAIWDRADRLLTLARDPMGIKPLYVTEQQGGLAFASELSALRTLPEHRFDIDDAGVHDFFSFGHVRTPRCIYAQARSLQPGHVLRIGPEGDSHSRAFWRPRFRAVSGRPEREWVEETRERVLTTVRRHMLSDVPVGAFLSGGVDSAAIAAAMTRTSGNPIKALTIGFPGSRIDETAAARRVAEHLGCEHIIVPLTAAAASDVLPQVQRGFDEPTAANSAIPLWYLSRAAAQHVKVVLCGEGGDELFVGYKRHRNAELINRWRPLIEALEPLSAGLEHLPRGSSRALNYLVQNAQRVRQAARLDTGFKQFFAATQISSPALRAAIFTPDFRARHAHLDSFDRLQAEHFADPELRRLSALEQFLMGDLQIHMPSSLLFRLDRATMAHSVEARVPFLSHEFVDWSMTIPLDLKLRAPSHLGSLLSGKVGKHVLREAVRPWLPQGALDGPKRGFQMPLADWFHDDFSGFARDAWISSGASKAGYLQPRAVDALFDAHRAGKADHGRILYAIAMFSCWWMQQAERSAFAALA